MGEIVFLFLGLVVILLVFIAMVIAVSFTVNERSSRTVMAICFLMDYKTNPTLSDLEKEIVKNREGTLTAYGLKSNFLTQALLGDNYYRRYNLGWI